MAKAYDRVEWQFLYRIMRAMGFDEAWINLITMCVSIVKYNVLHDECVHETIIPERGLR